jgi:glutamate/tyrosine decarboxylase-like PLP-dependent enzyme
VARCPRPSPRTGSRPSGTSARVSGRSGRRRGRRGDRRRVAEGPPRLPATPRSRSTTGCQMAHVTALAAARHAVPRSAGWDVRERGLAGPSRSRRRRRPRTSPSTVRCACSASAASQLVVVAADAQGRMEPDGLRAALADIEGPAIVCAQAGEVNTGSFDPSPRSWRSCARPTRGFTSTARSAVGGAAPRDATSSPAWQSADSWATDAHKWLNVPYDCGLVFCARPEAHRRP